MGLEEALRKLAKAVTGQDCKEESLEAIINFMAENYTGAAG